MIGTSLCPHGGKDNLSYDESECCLLPCDMQIDSMYEKENGAVVAQATMIKERNPIEIMEQRLEEIADKVIQYSGEEKLEELRAKIRSFKTDKSVDSLFSVEDIGKATFNKTYEEKESASSQMQQDIKEIEEQYID